LTLIRTTLMLDESVIKKLRNIQSKKIGKSTMNVSFSKVVNEVLKEKL